MSTVPVIKARGKHAFLSFWLSEVFKAPKALNKKSQPVSDFKDSLLRFPLITQQAVCKVLLSVSACSGLVFLRWGGGTVGLRERLMLVLKRNQFAERQGGEVRRRVKAAGR